MALTKENVREITQNVWTSMLNLDVTGEETAIIAKADGNILMGCVQITGAWEGCVILECSATLARHCAAAMFGTELDATSEQEVQDAFGELTNMVGGNIKSILPIPSQLSLPVVAEGRGFKFAVPSSKEIHNCAFLCLSLPLCVRVIQKDQKSNAPVAGTGSKE